MVKDGIVLADNNNRVVLIQYSFCELVKHLLSHYMGTSHEESSETVDRSPLSALISSTTDVILLAHEYPYYWAMTMY